MPIQYEIFVGFLINAELKCSLKKLYLSIQKGKKADFPLIESVYENKQYLGLKAKLPLSCTDLKQIEKSLRSELQFYFPRLNLSNRPTYIFLESILS